MTESHPAHRNLGSYLQALRGAKQLVEIETAVDPHLELPEIHRRIIAANGPALLFERPVGGDMPVVTNLFGTTARVEMAFGRRPAELVRRIAALPHELMPPSLGKFWGQRDIARDLLRIGLKGHRDAPVLELATTPPRLDRLPMLTTWPEDGGAFITLPLVHTQHPDGPSAGAPNLGMYRIQRHGPTETGMHWQIGKGGGFHHQVAETRDQALPVNIYVGGPPAMVLAAIAPLPENVPELLLASLLSGGRLSMAKNPGGPIPLVAEAEIALVGEVPAKIRRPEGPFGDHYGYYSLQHDYPVFRCHAQFRRRDAVFPATVVGKPRQEDFYIGDYLQELLSPVFPLVMPNVLDLWSYGETGYHSLAAAVVKQRYKREAMSAAFRILGEGQLSLTKFLLVLDRPRDLKDFRGTLEAVLERCDFRTDLYLFGNLSMDTLDYNGPKVNEGSKGVMLGVGDPIRELPAEFHGEAPRDVRDLRVFCRGCLVIEAASKGEDPGAAERLVADPAFADWPLVVLVDDAERCARSEMNFLWMAFTRFEPAADIHAARTELLRMHPSMQAPILIDARLRPGFPGELHCDPETATLVDRRWKEYFPEGDVEMGDSEKAHLD